MDRHGTSRGHKHLDQASCLVETYREVRFKPQNPCLSLKRCLAAHQSSALCFEVPHEPLWHMSENKARKYAMQAVAPQMYIFP